MAQIAFNVALGKGAYYCSLPAANDAIGVLVLQSSGLGTDATLRDCATVAAVLGAATEQTTMGRKIITSATATVDNTNDRVGLDIADQTWLNALGATVGALVFYYDPDTTTSTDSTRIPISKHDWSIIPDGSDATATIADFMRITSAA
ncbi:hypothetical protein KCMC57_63820 (plasmid) [Kitasatospora sp. CMC57]|uniref:Uncharacterized protein n=1 Tax=Kitasatospora sp. CMC57 TaxID=3231513 RepID=A0AB33K356_9ACTN